MSRVTAYKLHVGGLWAVFAGAVLGLIAFAPNILVEPVQGRAFVLGNVLILVGLVSCVATANFAD